MLAGAGEEASRVEVVLTSVSQSPTATAVLTTSSYRSENRPHNNGVIAPSHPIFVIKLERQKSHTLTTDSPITEVALRGHPPFPARETHPRGWVFFMLRGLTFFWRGASAVTEVAYCVPISD